MKSKNEHTDGFDGRTGKRLRLTARMVLPALIAVAIAVGGSFAWYYSGRTAKGQTQKIKTESAGTVFNEGYMGYVRHDETGTDSGEDTSVTAEDMITYTMLDAFTLNTFDSVFGRNKYTPGFIRFKIVLDGIDTASPPDLTLTLTRKAAGSRETGKHYMTDVSYVRFALAPAGSALSQKDAAAQDIYSAAYEMFVPAVSTSTTGTGSSGDSTSDGTGDSTSDGTGDSTSSGSDTSGSGDGIGTTDMSGITEAQYFDDTNVITYSVSDYADCLMSEDGQHVLYVLMEAEYDPVKVVTYVQKEAGYKKALRLGETDSIQFTGDLEKMTITVSSGN